VPLGSEPLGDAAALALAHTEKDGLELHEGVLVGEPARPAVALTDGEPLAVVDALAAFV